MKKQRSRRLVEDLYSADLRELTARGLKDGILDPVDLRRLCAAVIHHIVGCEYVRTENRKAAVKKETFN